MIKALFFALKIVLFVGVALWVAERPGSIRLEWLDYVVTLHMGLFLLLCLAVMLLALFIYQFLRAITGFPASYGRYREVKSRDKGYLALTRGLSAVAAGDTKMALSQARQASKFLPEDQGLSLLLEAQAARLDGREDDALGCFVALLENKDASFLGVRGLLQAALDRRDDETAKRLIDRALGSYPKQPWLLTTAYGLYIRTQDWAAARRVLKRAEKAGAISVSQGQGDRAAMFLAEALADLKKVGQGEALNADALRQRAVESMKKAVRVVPAFVPAVLMLAVYYRTQEDFGAAQRVLKKAWKLAPHEVYVAVWVSLLPEDQKGDALERLKHAAKLVQWGDSVALAHCFVGQAAMDAGLWGDARGAFDRAEDLEPSAFLYRLRAALEERSVHDDVAAKAWLEKAVSASGARAWVCRDTGQAYDVWQPVVQPSGAFNTLVWGQVSEGAAGETPLLLAH